MESNIFWKLKFGLSKDGQFYSRSTFFGLFYTEINLTVMVSNYIGYKNVSLQSFLKKIYLTHWY